MTDSLVKIGLVDDHIPFRSALASAIQAFGGFSISLQAANGRDFIEKLDAFNKPSIIILDLSMPEMDGHATLRWLNKNHPEIRILILTMHDAESILPFPSSEVSGFLKKDISPFDLKQTLQRLVISGSSLPASDTDRKKKTKQNPGPEKIILNENEILFLKCASTDMTFEEIAQKMQKSVHVVDQYKNSLFLKLHVKSRVGLARYAIKNGIARIEL